MTVENSPSHLVGSGTGAVVLRLRFQPPPHRTERTDFPHYVLLFASGQGLCDECRWGRFRVQAGVEPYALAYYANSLPLGNDSHDGKIIVGISTVGAAQPEKRPAVAGPTGNDRP